MPYRVLLALFASLGVLSLSCSSPNGPEPPFRPLSDQAPVVTGIRITNSEGPMQLAVWGEPSDINMPSGNPPAAPPFEMDNPYPNPTEFGLIVNFTLPRQSVVSMWVVRARAVASDNTDYVNLGGGSIFAGQSVVRKLTDDKLLTAGRFAVRWDSRDDAGNLVPAGFYRVYFRAGDHSAFHDVLLYTSPYDLPPDLRNPGIH